MRKLIRRYYQFKIIALLAITKVISLFHKESYWVLHERGTDARDNAYVFYKYLKEKHPEQKVRFIIDKNSPDFHKVKTDAIHFGSLKNYWAIATAEKIISTHVYFGLPHMNQKLFRLFELNQKFCFLQHGVIQCNMPSLCFDQAAVRLFICGAKPEWEHINGEFGYPPGIVRYTGLARHDNLHDIETKRQILVMPTWRMYISDEKDFLASEYYNQWNGFLSDPKLSEYLEKNDLTLVFYPHFEMQKYLHWFHSGDKRIILADFANFDVQTLLKESKLLVTDYSSVFFDFAYMRKAVVYFQFDTDDFFSKHYGRGYFSFSEMGFGPVVNNVEDLIQGISHSMNNGFNPTGKYRKRMEEFFPLYDRENCERIYDAICSI